MCVGKGRVCGDGGMCWGVCGCVNEMCMEVTGCGDGCVGVGVGVFVCGV